MRDQQLTVFRAIVYNSYGTRLFTAQIATRQWIRRKEANRTEFICTHEAEVTNNRRLHSRYCTIEANYWHTWSIARPLCDSMATCFKFQRCMDTIMILQAVNSQWDRTARLADVAAAGAPVFGRCCAVWCNDLVDVSQLCELRARNCNTPDHHHHHLYLFR